jgi:hypothetical protein
MNLTVIGADGALIERRRQSWHRRSAVGLLRRRKLLWQNAPFPQSPRTISS